MLTQIHISHLATIEDLQLELSPGTTMITGETGAGKSIIIDALELALGARATVNCIREGQEKAEIHIRFDVKSLPEVSAWLKNYDLDNEFNECIIRRTIYRDGRSRSYINQLPTTLQPLRELSHLLINIVNQQEHQSLLKSDTQRHLLDRYAGHYALVLEVEKIADDYHTLTKQITELKKLSEEQMQRGEFLRFQLQELETLHLLPDEFHSLDLEHKQLANSDELIKNVNHVLSSLSENEENNVSRMLHHMLLALETVQRVDPKIPMWITSLKNILVEVHDLETECRHYLDTLNLDPARLQFLENRITAIFDMARKHKVAPNELLDLQNKMAGEVTALETSDERLSKLYETQQIIEKNYFATAKTLSDSRKKSAKKLEKEITTLIRELSLPNGTFQIDLQPQGIPFSSQGLEKIVFQIKTNAGSSLQPLTMVASGGELSRMSLAIHAVTAKKHMMPTLIFDEVDVGIGGKTAETVGKLLRRLGETHQVLCITHLPQVAAQSHHHLRVEKWDEANLTYSKIIPLTSKEKIQEIARMLGGVKITQKTLAHAREMLEEHL